MKKTRLTDEELEYIAGYLEDVVYSLKIDGSDDEKEEAEIMSTIARKCNTILTERMFAKAVKKMNRL